MRNLMNKISGKITHKETGIGIPDLLAVIYDVDPNTRPEEIQPNETTEVDSSISIAIPPLSSFGDRLGSVLTDREGNFTLGYEDDEFKIRNAEEKRPDLLLVVAAPEESGQDPNSRILYVSTAVRQNAGRTETYLIRLTTEQLNKAGIPLPSIDREDSESSSSMLARLSQVETRRENLKAGTTEIAKKRVDQARARLRSYHIDFRPQLQKAISRLAENPIAPERVVLPGESVSEKSNAAIRRGIEQVVNGNNPQSRAPVRGYLNLSDEQKERIRVLVDADGNVDDADLQRALYGDQSARNTNAFLVRENPLLQFCREMTARERECENLLSEDENGSPPTDNGTPTAPESPLTAETITDEDIPRYLAHLMETMTSPEEQVVNGLTPRASNEEVQKQIKELSLDKSPADTPAYHDFHNLQIAFEHVWQEAIDEGVLDLAEDAYQAIVELGGNPGLSNTDVAGDPIRNLLQEGKLVVKAHRDHRDGRSDENSDSSSDMTVRDHRDGLIVRDHRGQTGTGGGTVIVSTSNTPAPPAERLPQILTELQQRLKGNYNFTVYAANCKERSVNFGLLLTYCQKWTPEAYQAGELVKTLTLAPKQTQKISVTRKVHKKRFRKEVENSLRSWREESAQTSRAEQEIIRRASAKTNFNLTAQESVSAEVPGMGGGSSSITSSFGREASKSSDDIKKSFHEAVFKAAQEYKTERTTEVTTEESEDFETVETTEITNPNDEIAVTFLFYELQRRYRVTEAIHQLTPVILVAQEVPRPQEIDGDWLLAHDWILRRVILDDSFLPALDYLSENVAGDEVALAEMRVNIKQQREIVAEIKQELAAARERAAAQQVVLQHSVWKKWMDGENGGGGGLFDFVTKPFEAVAGVASDVAASIGAAANKIGERIYGDDGHKGQTAHDAMKEAAERAADEARDLMFRLEREVTALNALLEKYAKAYRDHVNHLTQVARCCYHVMQNALYYMQAIWSHEPPDQRFFRLHNTKVPVLKAGRRKIKINLDDIRADSLVSMAHRVLPRFSPSPVRAYGADFITEVESQLEFAALSEVADLDTLLGFKGNYMIFPLKESNALTDFMMDPYVDRALNALIDPDDIGNWSLEDFARYVCCLKERLTDEEFETIRPQLKTQYKRLLTAARRSDEMITIPSGSLFIEALPATHSLIEEFKARHRAVDVKKAQAEVREMELENIRRAARILAGEREDPKIDKKIVVEGEMSGINISDGDAN
jgi:hypothetical protein